MMRTFWLATICLAVLSALAVGRAVRTIIAERPTDQTTVGTGLAQDALSKADRLEINYVARNEILPQPAVPQTESIVPAVSSVPPPVETKIIRRHSHDPHAISSSAAKPKQANRPAPTREQNDRPQNAVKPQMVLNQQNR
jgi:hypothetical protein